MVECVVCLEATIVRLLCSMSLAWDIPQILFCRVEMVVKMNGCDWFDMDSRDLSLSYPANTNF